MAKNKLSDFDPVANNNVDIGGIGIQGTNNVSNFDNAKRYLMKAIADWLTGVYPVQDTASFADPADLTKQFRFDGGNVTAGQKRVISVPDRDMLLGSRVPTATKSADYNVTAADSGGVIYVTASINITFAAISALGSGFWCQFVLTGGNVTFNPDGSETIDGATTLVAFNGSTVTVFKDAAGTALVTDGGYKQGMKRVVVTPSGTAATVTGVPSWVAEIDLSLSLLSLNANQHIYLRLGDSGGIETTGYDVYSGVLATASVSAAGETAGSRVASSTGTSTGSGNLFLRRTDPAGTNWTINTHSGDNGFGAFFSHGAKSLSDVLTQFQLVSANGVATFDGGTFSYVFRG